MSKNKTIESFGAKLRGALGDAIIAEAGDDFIAMCADDIVFQFPFSPAGSVTEIRGRDTLARYLAKASNLIAFESFGSSVTHPSTDGETFIIEFSCKASGRETGVRYDQNYIAVIRLKNGRIAQYRDYWNPLILLDAAGGIECLKTTFEEFIDE
ncbi:nuclear transport factor 2 family protein [Marinobacterium jannaschii]|uniref:nuclear transport factor 2 family protein n=1 Tax=Marinobacterium jannaschii TaxID=64970 RepID=UPI0006886E47|nr:nuclear transport factor 2 family protein [Marinobacterium jannaschii]